ncbi:hypothetical protein ASG46_06115 [Bacillus sp. Leaf49]|uniref:hypothetical protein n=1 Tax=Bacillus TaxID=1386 RepID=UPI0006F33761|nr:hypothetical protein [Bacillus sp. Leaf49]KQU12110.1 hypothetical protein ASG46_06115 [Bacillus sp. Leaf49]
MTNKNEYNAVYLKNDFGKGQHSELIRYEVLLDEKRVIKIDLNEFPADVEKFYAFICLYYLKHYSKNGKISAAYLKNVSKEYVKGENHLRMESPPLLKLRIESIVEKYKNVEDDVLRINQFNEDSLTCTIDYYAVRC